MLTYRQQKLQIPAMKHRTAFPVVFDCSKQDDGVVALLTTICSTATADQLLRQSSILFTTAGCLLRRFYHLAEFSGN